jgi:DNA-binding transcriptional LysR family regulator
LAQASFGLALVPESSVRDELRRGLLVALDIPAMRTAIPVVALHRRNGYLPPAARSLLPLLVGKLTPVCLRRVASGRCAERTRQHDRDKQ